MELTPEKEGRCFQLVVLIYPSSQLDVVAKVVADNKAPSLPFFLQEKVCFGPKEVGIEVGIQNCVLFYAQVTLATRGKNTL